MSYLLPLLRDLLSEMLDAEPEVDVVTSLRQDAELADEVWRAKADVLIVQLGKLAIGRGAPLPVPVLGVSTDAERAAELVLRMAGPERRRLRPLWGVHT